MKVRNRKSQQKDILEILPHAIESIKKSILTPFFGDDLVKKYAGEQTPLRSELFSVEQLADYAGNLAKTHVLISGSPSEQLLKRLADNESVLLDVHKLLTESIKENQRIVPAGEWLLDNFYLIEEQIHTGKKHLPKGYSKGLPQLQRGPSEGLPRVYDIAVEIISHTDGRIDLSSLGAFIHAYQEVTPLKIGELWAIPIMLRLALLENLRRLAIKIAFDITNKSLADRWADAMTNAVENNPKDLVLVIADMARSNPPMESSFVAELIRRLQGKGPVLALPLSWVEQRLSENNLTSTELVQIENQKQAADQVSISNSISSLRFLSTNDWREFVEQTSKVEELLRQDATGIYPHMDFFTRDNYRHAVEEVAKHSTLSEQQVAATALKLANDNYVAGSTDIRTTHVGYFLTGKGLRRLERLVGMKFTFWQKCRRFFNRVPLVFYAGIISILTLLMGWLFMYKIYTPEWSSWVYLLISLPVITATSQLSISLVNWLSTILAKPDLLPRMDFSKGIPESARSMVVIPTMLSSMETLDQLVEDLEVRFLANRDANLHFALLTDFNDADREHMPDDEALLHAARSRIIQLNRKYDRPTNDTFFLFHRPRTWNAKDKIWMGYERKRGKLGHLNELLRGKSRDAFSVIIADESYFDSIRYIITLDTDTELPRDAAWRLVGTIDHPLNRPVYSQKKKRVTEGYTILQPRVSNSLPAAGSSVYTRIHGNEPGTDPYTRTISDVYQDLFHEGSFIGKGIYEIDAFEKVLGDRFPPNRILSHDLLEGCYSRSGLVSDVQLYEEYPSRYSADMKRRHRWIRGDWQIATWLLPVVPDARGKYIRNPLSALAKWKIADNLRRSLFPFSLLLLFILGWLYAEPVTWTLMCLGILFLPAVISFIWEAARKPKDINIWQHINYTIRSAKDNWVQTLLSLATLPYEVYINTSAILVTLWRMYITGKKLLEWNPSSSPINKVDKNLLQTYGAMWFSPFTAAGVLYWVAAWNPITLIFAFPVIFAWAVAPFIVWVISKPVKEEAAVISADEKRYLRRLSRKIWFFFETFITAADNWLPPDNYQEEPVERLAHRTSPTNIGLSLLANLTAYDFGYITATSLIERCTHTIGTMQAMEKYKGHLYNWYDTETLQPLNPRYVSTVDSGNLAGHLITLRQGLLALGDEKVIRKKIFEGLTDTVNVLLELQPAHFPIQLFREQLDNVCLRSPENPAQYRQCIDKMELAVNELKPSIEQTNDKLAIEWTGRLDRQLIQIKNELYNFMPWVLLPEPPSGFEEPDVLKQIPTLRELARMEHQILPVIDSYYSDNNTAAEEEWLDRLRTGITEAVRRAKETILMAERLAGECEGLADMEYAFLYDSSQHLLAIGYNVDENRRDHSYYDLLASEARLSVFVAIAQGKLPQESWFALGRQLTNEGVTPMLLSWSGSMFEYLMPLLVMPGYENTLLDQTNKGVILKQIEYGRKRNIPWGISESGYNMIDTHMNYQYKAFGVPGSGFKRGLSEDLVIAPYATIMALMVNPEEAYRNLQVMREEGFERRYGFVEAVDYTAARLPRGKSHVVINSFMAHHQGMAFLSLAYLLLDQPMQKRFVSDVHFKSTLLLLQERIPRITTFYSPGIHVADSSMVIETDLPMRVINTPNTQVPEVQLLSNGRYEVMVTNSGGGYSRWKGLAVNRWREDSTCDNWGTFCYIRDLDNNQLWSSSYQPVLQEGENYEVVFSQGRAEFRRRDHSIETHTEIVVSPEDDVELRRVHITNRSRKRRYIEITSYAEVVLASPVADAAHTAFSNLFVQTEIVEPRHAIICSRRPRSVKEQTPFMFHLMKVHDAEVAHVSYETDRSRFIGRGNTVQQPLGVTQSGTLSGSQGSVLDPVIAIQYRIIIEPLETVVVDMVYGMGDTRELANGLIEKYQDKHLANRAFELAWTHSQVILRQINAMESDAQLYGRLASSVIYANPSLRADAAIITKNRRGQSGLWSSSISGDLPIVLVQIEDQNNIGLVKQMVQAHAYWRLKGLLVDLVIWNEDHGGYRQELQNEILALIAPGVAADMKDKPGGVFIRSAEQLSVEDRILFQSVARIVISDSLGSLEEQLNRRNKLRTIIPYFTPSKIYPTLSTPALPVKDLQFFNGTGGFSKDGKEYVINIMPNSPTPAPWVNVIANPQFGTVISESGQAYTWIENAHEFRLTPWNNDPVSDKGGEVFYLRDEESGRFWSPVPLPRKSKSHYTVRHGFGYSIFEHTEDGIISSMRVHVDPELPVKYIVLKLHNRSGRLRRLSATGYMEWVLGELRPRSVMHVITEADSATGALLARNAYNTEWGNRVAFFDTDEQSKSITTDRTEFIGRNGTLANPDAMNRSKLSGKTGAALDPCAVIQAVFDLKEEEEREIIFRIGAGNDMGHALQLIRQVKGGNVMRDSFARMQQYWKETLETVRIDTPDTAVNLMGNGWLSYQVIASRLWARSGYYQSGGAFGYRDQLQDTLSLMHIRPELVRKQILLCASRQFREGDVQHWWHPPVGRGVRTTCSDDYLWLSFVTCRYVLHTGDTGILDESVYFLEGRPLNVNEESYYDMPARSAETASLYEHCVRAVKHGLRFGQHGLPLMGSGDWNDGMDKVGEHGKGESIWLAFLLYDILLKFSDLADSRNDTAFAAECREKAETLREDIEKNGWDGEWYRRAYFDDGTPLGSAGNEECKIDSIAQSWSVLSGAAPKERSVQAMQSAYRYLVRKDPGIIQLFDPPFDKSSLNPGYIKGYVPGVRENGGQYTHAAIWLVMAFAALGDADKVWELFQLINPVNHATTPEETNVYKTEPYVIAADVYAVAGQKGRGGWTWYTGSAGWMYQLLFEWLVGIRKEGDRLVFNPCIPDSWPEVAVQYKYQDTVFAIKIIKDRSAGKGRVNVVADEQQQPGNSIQLINDQKAHSIIVKTG
ncbi:GH36-type glycosyl hydrolase domain-containing protein [Sediminibacterium ginsengisoli]|uniref:Cellobiose phosphorylase n=1 Tax=Sediminibacterium ginsengisoli TaxID=413434 RepID=A0A1T4Q0M5_9BACT|nr:glucoamylase family protein [Sediminibacterium ginsengisoli]SJZ97061.1 Cellobiose phosphorylase [Sediminibacterium ginsengisoli]